MQDRLILTCVPLLSCLIESATCDPLLATPAPKPGPIVICEGGAPKASNGSEGGGGSRGGSGNRSLAVVSLGWLMDSVATHNMRPFEPYLRQL
jgi:hypothetical protein